jgi:hypothetical protein
LAEVRAAFDKLRTQAFDRLRPELFRAIRANSVLERDDATTRRFRGAD